MKRIALCIHTWRLLIGDEIFKMDFRSFIFNDGAALVAVLLVGFVILGPRQIMVTSFRAGLTAWITRTVRDLAGR